MKETLHRVPVVDPYRWLEGSSAPEADDDPALDARVSEWTDLQNTHTRRLLDSLPGRAELESRLRRLMECDSINTPQMRGDRIFFWKRAGTQAQYVSYVQEGPAGAPRALVDPNAIDRDGLTALDWTAPNHDGSLMAFGLYRAGDENTTLNLVDVVRGERLPDIIAGRVEDVQWMPDSSGFFYARLADLSNPYSRQIRFHRLGAEAADDPILFAQYQEGPLSTTWGPFAWTSRDARWMILGYWTGTDSNDLWVIDLRHWFATGVVTMRTIVEGEKAISTGPVVGDTLFMQTTLGAPNGRLVAVDLHRPDRERWREIVPERKDVILQSVSPARGMLALDALENAASVIEIHALDGTFVRRLELPGIGSASIETEEERTDAFVTFTSFNEPTSIYRVDLADGSRELWARPAVPVDPSTVEVEQIFYPSKDGTRVPMFLVHRKGLELDGNNPVLLTGYGGFGIPETPAFMATLFPWFEAGGVYALPNLRGGGEFGESWHRDGMLDRKQNVFDDFIAAAEWLIDRRYTNPSRLAISGGSNGGLLTGAALVQRPELFAAAVCAVPLLDMLRYHHFLMARYWVPEYGSAEDPAQFRYLLDYSPYHNVKPGAKYPAVLFTAGENDTRVHALHARKMAARMQEVTASDPDARPVLLWIDREAGHGQGKPLDLRIRDVADQRIFFMWQLGMLDG
ncbi:MAG: prolyl oligopeptidase family serine peptidase [Thermoanaerobaculia bacterium]